MLNSNTKHVYIYSHPNKYISFAPALTYTMHAYILHVEVKIYEYTLCAGCSIFI